MATEQFRTLNSTYEINRATKHIRRVQGANNPTDYQGTDCEWQAYQSITVTATGCAYIQWDNERATLTSRISDGWNGGA